MLTSVLNMRLNTAGVVIGWIGIVGSFIGTIILATALGYADVLSERIAEAMQDPKITLKEIHTAFVIVASVYLAVCVLSLLSSAMLVLGTLKERHLLLLPWLINSGVSLLLNIIYNVVALLMVISGSAPAGDALPSLLLSVLILALYIYIYYGIYSLFKQIQANREQQRPLISDNSAVPHQTTTYPNYTKI